MKPIKLSNQKAKLTESYILHAFQLLIEEKPFHKITVTDIIQKAGINRTTFYHHYVDKYDLRDKICNKFLNNVEILLQGTHNGFSLGIDDFLAFIKPSVQYLFMHKNEYELLLHSNMEFDFLEKMRDLYTKHIMQIIKGQPNLVPKYDPYLFARLFSSAAIETILWDLQNPDMHSQEESIAMIQHHLEIGFFKSFY